MTWRLIGVDQNRWKFKLFSPPNSFKTIGEGIVNKKNIEIMKKINQFKFKGYGLLLGSSRKSWINGINKSDPLQRVGGSLASAIYCYQRGVDIFRVHDVKETIQSLEVFKKLCSK